MALTGLGVIEGRVAIEGSGRYIGGVIIGSRRYSGGTKKGRHYRDSGVGAIECRASARLSRSGDRKTVLSLIYDYGCPGGRDGRKTYRLSVTACPSLRHSVTICPSLRQHLSVTSPLRHHLSVTLSLFVRHSVSICPSLRHSVTFRPSPRHHLSVFPSPHVRHSVIICPSLCQL